MTAAQDGDGRFADFVMKGKRFDPEGMPAEAAPEVAAFRKAVFAIARQLWLNANPDRRRVTPNTLEEFDLRLVGVEQGSSKPVLKLHRPQKLDQSIVDEWEPHIYAARDQLVSAVRTIGSTGRPPAKFPRECLPDVERLGRSLLDDESVGIGRPNAPRRAIYTHEIKNLVKKIDAVLEDDTRFASVVGVIVEFDSVRSSFKLQPEDGGPDVACRLDAYDEGLAKRARDLCSLDGVVAPDVQVFGTTKDSVDRVISLYEVTAIDLVRSVWEKRVMGRIELLKSLADGWNGPGSLAPSADALGAIEAIVAELSGLTHSVRIGATHSGSLAFEWNDEENEYTAEIGRQMTVHFYVDNTVTDEISESSSPYSPGDLMRFLAEGVAP